MVRTMPTPDTDADVIVAVPSGTSIPSALLAALSAQPLQWPVRMLWCGDPHRRPLIDPAGGAPSVEWVGEPKEPSGRGWNRLLVGLQQRHYEMARMAAAAVESLDARPNLPVVCLWSGAVGVSGPLASLLTPQAPIVLIPRVLGLLPDDGFVPDERSLLHDGPFHSTMAVFRDGAQTALAWLASQCADCVDADVPTVAALLGRVHELFDAAVCSDPAVGAGWWRDAPVAPTLVDLDGFEQSTPWLLRPSSELRARNLLSSLPLLRDAIDSVADQTVGPPQPLALPGGIMVDPIIRRTMADGLAMARSGTRSLPPEPFGSSQSAFLRWLEEPVLPGTKVGRYWKSVRASRADLQTVFPAPDSASQEAFVEWIERAWQTEDYSVLIGASAPPLVPPVTDVDRVYDGLNLVGYLTFGLSLGTIARRIEDSLRAARVPMALINHGRTQSPLVRPIDDIVNEAVYGTNLVVVNADQFAFLAADHFRTLLEGRRTIGYWFWELEQVPAQMVEAISLVDEIWAGSRFVVDAFKAVTNKPVRFVPVPVPLPEASSRTRESFDLPKDRFAFVVAFDYFSVVERKNPFSAIAAFRAAFAPGEGPVLIIKTANAALRWKSHERVLLAAAGRDDIVVVDGYLSHADQMALVREADCLVSLHRSEGLGLHCAEAMWLRTPVIATRYSGNLDFMDDSNSMLVDATMVPVRNGEGAYPAEAVWAEPDIDQAAASMRKIVVDSRLRASLSAAAHATMKRQPSDRSTGRTIAAYAGLGETARRQPIPTRRPS